MMSTTVAGRILDTEAARKLTREITDGLENVHALIVRLGRGRPGEPWGTRPGTHGSTRTFAVFSSALPVSSGRKSFSRCVSPG